ncbi:MAG TPA: GNAT family N-acetyltransferase [Acidisphaera sp.]|nr:GNAT family N-acetyltransferase [Acidisphaera sp.]
MPDLHDNTARGRYEMDVDGDVAFVTYETKPDRLILVHTEVPRALEGRGIGSALARAVLDDIRRRGLRVEPRCPFIAAFIARHSDFADLVAR